MAWACRPTDATEKIKSTNQSQFSEWNQRFLRSAKANQSQSKPISGSG
jgi:hypothetical protein